MKLTLVAALVLSMAIAGLGQTTNGLILVPPDQISPFGTFWLWSGVSGPHPEQSAPLPCWSGDPSTPIYSLGPGQFLVMDGSGEGDDSADTAMASPMARSFGAMDDPGGSGGGDDTPLFQFDTNLLWLEIVNVQGGLANMCLHHATDEVYSVWSATNLETAWQVETEV